MMSKTLGTSRGPTAFDQALKSMKPEDAKQWQELKKVDWESVQKAVTRLFQLKKYPELAADLPQLNDKLNELFKSEIGQFIGEIYHDQILKRCMIILRQELIDETGDQLLKKLADIWTQFYTSILPTLQAIFVPVQLKNLSIRALTLISFRDVVLLKLNIGTALDEATLPMPPQITQMLLVLQSVHQNPISDKYFELQELVQRVVKPYICMELPRARTKSPEGKDIGSPDQSLHRADTMDTDTMAPIPQLSSNTHMRRHSLGGDSK